MINKFYQFIFLPERLSSTRNKMNMKWYNDSKVPVDPPAKLALVTTVQPTVITKTTLHIEPSRIVSYEEFIQHYLAEEKQLEKILRQYIKEVSDTICGHTSFLGNTFVSQISVA